MNALRLQNALSEALSMLYEYAHDHVLTCLIPALFIAGAISVFVSQASVMQFLGPGAGKAKAFGVASVSGTVLAVCSCTVLPLFAGIYRMGAGLGPACTFLYSGPAINVLAMALTAGVLGAQIGVARAAGAVFSGIIIGIIMHLAFRRDDAARINARPAMPDAPPARPLWQITLYFASMVGVLVFMNMRTGRLKWALAALSALLLVSILVKWFGRSWWKSAEVSAWFSATWGFAKQILPLLFAGVLAAGFLFGRPGHEALIPEAWVHRALGGNSLPANLFASAAGALMYLATLTEVPILQGLIGNGMGEGPALALLLAGPALSLPSMLVIGSVLGLKKTAVFIFLVIVMASAAGFAYGAVLA
jgi:uncharacterized membrane protein YraQ (UPF0718 family)